MTIWGREPAVVLGAVNAIVALVVGFGLNVTGEQQALIHAAASAVIALWTRRQVTPNENVAVTVDDLKHEGYLP